MSNADRLDDYDLDKHPDHASYCMVFRHTASLFFLKNIVHEAHLKLICFQTIAGLKTATPKVVWTDSTASRCCNIWAPEIHYVDGAWYMCVRPLSFVSHRVLTTHAATMVKSYYSAGTSDTFDNQRSHVLKGSSNIIWDSTWSYASAPCSFPNKAHSRVSSCCSF